MSKITIGYSPAYLKWEGSHASPMRAHLAVEHIKAQAEFDGVEVEVPDPRRPRIGMQKGEVVARLVELTPVALRARAALRPGGHAFTEDSPVEDIIRFLMSAPSIAQAGSSASGRYDAGEEILEGDGIGHAATAEMLGTPRVATARSNGASFTMGG